MENINHKYNAAELALIAHAVEQKAAMSYKEFLFIRNYILRFIVLVMGIDDGIVQAVVDESVYSQPFQAIDARGAKMALDLRTTPGQEVYKDILLKPEEVSVVKAAMKLVVCRLANSNTKC